MKTIHKYELKLHEHDHVMVPAGATPLSVGTQHRTVTGEQVLVLWALVDAEQQKQEALGYWAEWTGNEHKAPNDARFLGTATVASAVYHVFVRTGADNPNIERISVSREDLITLIEAYEVAIDHYAEEHSANLEALEGIHFMRLALKTISLRYFNTQTVPRR